MSLSVVVIIELRVYIISIFNWLKGNESNYYLNGRRLIVNEGANENNYCEGLLKVFTVLKLS